MKPMLQQLKGARRSLHFASQDAREWIASMGKSVEVKMLLRDLENPVDINRFAPGSDWAEYPMIDTLRNQIIALNRIETAILKNDKDAEKSASEAAEDGV
jgi:hypothetical protein